MFCMKLIAVISHDNYYSQFCHPFCELVQLGQSPFFNSFSFQTQLMRL
jgi:hypothetical protein